MKTINLLESTMPKKTKTGKRYSPKRKENLLAKYGELRKSGQNAEQAAKQLHVPYKTFLRWKKGVSSADKQPVVETKAAIPKMGKRRGPGRPPAAQAPRSAKKRGPGRPPASAARRIAKRRGPGRPPASTAKKHAGLTLMTPAGFRIEGISSQELIRLLKALK